MPRRRIAMLALATWCTCFAEARAFKRGLVQTLPAGRAIKASAYYAGVPGLAEVMERELSRARGFQSLALVEGGERFYVVGRLDERVLPKVHELFTFMAETFRQLKGGGVRSLVAEFEEMGVVFVKLGFDIYLVATYRGLPLGAAYYEARRIASAVREVLPG